MKDLELLTKLFIIWNMNPEYKEDKEYNSQSFIARIIRKKMEVFKIDVKIPDELLMIIEICTGSNPGVSQVMLHEIMSKITSLTEGYLITPNDFTRVYPNDFPCIDNPKWDDHFAKLWESQKFNGSNLCDTPNWWKECFNKQA